MTSSKRIVQAMATNDNRCLLCECSLPDCHCVWSAIRQLQEQIQFCVKTEIDVPASLNSLYSMYDEVQENHDEYDKQIKDLQESFNDLTELVKRSWDDEKEHRKQSIRTVRAHCEKIEHEVQGYKNFCNEALEELNKRLQKLEFIPAVDARNLNPGWLNDKLPSIKQLNEITNKCLQESKEHTASNHLQQCIAFDEGKHFLDTMQYFVPRREGKPSTGHLQKCLAEKNAKIKECEEKYQALAREHGERGRKLDKALNDLNGAIMNDRQSREELTQAIKRIGYLGEALQGLSQENNALREQLNAIKKG